MISPTTPSPTHKGCSTCHFISASRRFFWRERFTPYSFASNSQLRIEQCPLNRLVASCYGYVSSPIGAIRRILCRIRKLRSRHLLFHRQAGGKHHPLVQYSHSGSSTLRMSGFSSSSARITWQVSQSFEISSRSDVRIFFV